MAVGRHQVHRPSPGALLEVIDQRDDVLGRPLADHDADHQSTLGIDAEGDVSDFARWWEGIKGKVVEILPGHMVHANDPCDQRDNPEAEGVVIEKDRGRGLLKGMGLLITCYFRRTLKNGREYTLDRARLSATVEYSDRASDTWRSPRP